MNRQFISPQKEKKYYSFGKLFVILDYLFIFYIFFRIEVIYSVFHFETNAGVNRTAHLYYLYIFHMFLFPLKAIILCIILQTRKSMKEKFAYRNTSRKWSLLSFPLPITIAFIFSLFFYDSIDQLIVEFPETYHSSIIPSYYLTYIHALIYSFIRVIFEFDYYKSFYFKKNKDLLIPISIVFYLILIIIVKLLPHEMLYMFF